MTKIPFINGSIRIYSDKLYIEPTAIFSSTKKATISFSDIKGLSAPFDHLTIETTHNAKHRLRFWDHQRAYMAMNAIKAALRDAGR